MNLLLPAENTPLMLPSYWYIIMAALSLMLPAGFVLVSAAGLGPRRAWDAAMGALAASGISVFLYWAFGYALHFGGIGLVYDHPELQSLVWEWSALSDNWGSGWGMAGLSGWFLSGGDVSPLMYSLFLAHLPWVMTAAMIPVLALRGRAPATATLLIAIFVGGFLYPIAGNWVQGGGWLSALGRNLNLGHGLIDYGGTGTVFLMAAGFGLSALLVWVPRREPGETALAELPAAHLPLLAISGSLLMVIGSVGWIGANPLQATGLNEIGLIRGTVSIMLSAGGGALVPVIYSWFVTGNSDPLMSSRGFTAGAIAGLAAAPFVQPGSAFFIGAIAGLLLPFVIYITDHVLKLDDVTGVIHMCIVPALCGLLLGGIFADGVSGVGWQLTGIGSHLGVTDQGVSGLLVARGYQPDFPAQLQSQIIGILALGLWGFLAGLVVCTPLSLLYRAVESIPGFTEEVPLHPADEYYPDEYFDESEVADNFDYVPTYVDPQSTPSLPHMSDSNEPQPRFTALTRRRTPRDDI